ncbi:MAG: NAD(P)-dependent oxidoreductase [Candidatus Latescibacteria bacterium]|nr:NAD(P)-dependent oxidoreductase [Candidatus Latescibacterota bacterium]
MRILITGTLSGLGKHLYETFGGIGWIRQTPATDREKIRRTGVDVLIHCAWNSRQSVTSDCLYTYVADTVLLTEEVVRIPHQKFIFLSSVDVYPRRPGPCSEDEIIDLHAVGGVYGITKLMSEAIVRQHCPNHTILRCVSLLGKYARKNSLIRIIDDAPCTLTLSGDSRLNYVLYTDVADFLRFAMECDVRGIYNVSSTEHVTLSGVADMLGKHVNFGSYRYDVGDIDNSKISSIFPAFKKTSQEVIAQFVRERTAKH